MNTNWQLKHRNWDLIVQSNQLLEASYLLELNEQRLILYVMSQIKKGDVDFKLCRIKAKDFADFFQIEQSNVYQLLKDASDSLTKKNITFEDPDNKKNYKYISWVASAEYVDGVLEIELSDKLKPYLLELKDNFTQFSISDIIKFKSLYSIRLYQLFMQYKKIGSRYYSVSELKKVLAVDTKYPRYANFKNKVINVAIKEINENSGLNITLAEDKQGRKVVGLKFKIDSGDVRKDDIQQETSIESNESNNTNDLLMDYQIEVLRKMFKDFKDVTDSDLTSMLKVAEGDINKIFEQYMIILSSKKKINNVTGFIIEGVKNGYKKFSIKKTQETKSNWNYSEEDSSDELDIMARITRMK